MRESIIIFTTIASKRTFTNSRTLFTLHIQNSALCHNCDLDMMELCSFYSGHGLNGISLNILQFAAQGKLAGIFEYAFSALTATHQMLFTNIFFSIMRNWNHTLFSDQQNGIFIIKGNVIATRQPVFHECFHFKRDFITQLMHCQERVCLHLSERVFICGRISFTLHPFKLNLGCF